MKKFFNYLQDAAYQLDVDAGIRSYSGRGMYGDSCVGIVCSMQDFVKVIAHAAIDAHEDEDCEINFNDIASKVRSDNMGLSTVFYWPSQKWEPEFDFEDDTESED